jgi:hypothetical protein|tara:strand:+ start:3054 stop:3308 length:255 start_codon:yes stop_codon:yes gene_type:complete
MKKETGIITLGILVALMPFLGFPRLFEAILLVAFGLGIAVLGFLLRKGQLGALWPKGRSADVYTENSAPQKNDSEINERPSHSE